MTTDWKKGDSHGMIWDDFEEVDEEPEFSCKNCTGYSEIDEESFFCTRNHKYKGIVQTEYSGCDVYDVADPDINDAEEMGYNRE